MGGRCDTALLGILVYLFPRSENELVKKFDVVEFEKSERLWCITDFMFVKS